MVQSFEEWMEEVRRAFDSLHLPMADWHLIGAFDYQSEYQAGAAPHSTATKASHHWWHEWNKSLNQDCRQIANCWLPRGHEGQCKPVA